LGADAYDDITWTNTDTDRFQIVCPFVIDREQGIGPNLTDGAYINYRFDLVTPPLTAARDGLQMFLNITSIQADGTTTTDFTDTNYAEYSVRNFKCAIFDDAQEQEFGTVDITATGDQGRFELDLGETLVGDRITSMDHGIIKVYDGSTYVDATDWRSLNSSTAGLGINKLAVRERMAFHRTGKRMERGQLISTRKAYLAPYTVLTDYEDSRIYFITALRYVATDDEYDATLILAGRDITGITEAQDNPQPSKDVTPPDAGNVPKPAMLGGTANNIVNTSYVSYNPLARLRFALVWTATIGSETLEGYWTVTNDGVGKYLSHQGEIPTSGFAIQRAVYVLAKGQGNNADTYTQPAGVQPTQGDSLNDTLALIQTYMNRIGTDSSYTFLITYDEVSVFTGILDSYPGAASAYSLRKLDKDYTGYAIRVRESAGNTLADIGFDSNGDLDTTALLAHTGPASGYVHTWYDQSGNGNDAVQSTNADQPQIVSSGTVVSNDGINAVFFDGTQKLPTVTNATLGIDGANDKSSFSVMSTPAGTDGGIIHGDTGLTYAALRLRSNGGNGNLRVEITGAGYTSSFDISDGTAHIASMTFNGTTMADFDLYVDGSSVSATGAQAVNTDGTQILNIGHSGAATSYNDIYISELIIYPSDQTSNVTGIESNINTYYTIY
jgi:hypothetical protein